MWTNPNFQTGVHEISHLSGAEHFGATKMSIVIRADGTGLARWKWPHKHDHRINIIVAAAGALAEQEFLKIFKPEWAAADEKDIRRHRRLGDFTHEDVWTFRAEALEIVRSKREYILKTARMMTSAGEYFFDVPEISDSIIVYVKPKGQ
jgi:hypothetical protein